MNTLQSKRLTAVVALTIMVKVLTGCVVANNASTSDISTSHKSHENSIAATNDEQKISYYISKLPDRNYVESYGDADNPRPWYTAAEALGSIGKPAIPALLERLDTTDPYELKLVLYALMLASQDPSVQAETNGNYLKLDTVLTEDGNEKNRQRALDWWQQYQRL